MKKVMMAAARSPSARIAALHLGTACTAQMMNTTMMICLPRDSARKRVISPGPACCDGLSI
jgi:hypothetical protein